MTANDDWKLPWSGHCRCERVSLRITRPPLMTMACHCTGCQRMTASAFSLTVMVPADGFEVTGDVVVGGLHGASKHLFCSYCLTWMFTRPEGMDSLVNVRATMLDDHSWFEPFIETFTKEKLAWASTPARHSFATLPELSHYEPLMREFAERAPRPR
ncbi:MAG TPA: GFA family protein [Polyangiaceae bacterium]|nr:GFA family protein [Polyangiaceae bacterium]